MDIDTASAVIRDSGSFLDDQLPAGGSCHLHNSNPASFQDKNMRRPLMIAHWSIPFATRDQMKQPMQQDQYDIQSNM